MICLFISPHFTATTHLDAHISRDTYTVDPVHQLLTIMYGYILFFYYKEGLSPTLLSVTIVLKFGSVIDLAEVLGH